MKKFNQAQKNIEVLSPKAASKVKGGTPNHMPPGHSQGNGNGGGHGNNGCPPPWQ
jgi:hypothetical protein